MSQANLQGSATPPPRPRWVELLVVPARLVGFVILLVGLFALRMLRRADPTLALVLVLLLVLAAGLLAGVGWYADLLLRDSRRERPSVVLALINFFLGLSLAIIVFHGVEAEALGLGSITDFHLGFLPRAGYGYPYSFGYGFAVSMGITLATVGLAALVGARLRKAGTAIVLLAGWGVLGCYGPQWAQARLAGVADLERWEVHSLVPDASGARVVVVGSARIHVFDLVSGNEPLSMEKPADTSDNPVISPDGRLLAAAGKNTVVLWSLANGKVRWQQDLSAVDVAFPADSASLWALRETELVQLSADDGHVLARKPLPGKYRVARLAGGGRFLAALASAEGKPAEELIVLPLPQMEPPIRWTFDKRVGGVLDISADGATVLVVSAGPESHQPLGGTVEYRQATAVDVKSKQPKWTFQANSSLRILRFTAGERAVLAVPEYGSAAVLDAASGVPLTLLPDANGAGYPVLSADGRTAWRLQYTDYDTHRLERWQLRRPLRPAAVR